MDILSAPFGLAAVLLTDWGWMWAVFAVLAVAVLFVDKRSSVTAAARMWTALRNRRRRR